MWFGIITLFPQLFQALQYGITGRALESKLITVTHWCPRDFSTDKHRRVDDKPYGGGPGMVMQAEPLSHAIHAAKTVRPNAKVIYLTPQGQLLNQKAVENFITYESLILLNGRYEGIDERLINTKVDEEWSIGDYVLSGGEFASLVLIDAITRCLPGTLGNGASAQQDSFAEQRLECPHYTRPEVFEGIPIPEVLKSGNHQAIAEWRLKQALIRTWQRRPELFDKQSLTPTEKTLLNRLIEK